MQEEAHEKDQVACKVVLSASCLWKGQAQLHPLSMLRLPCRATLTSLPNEIVEKIVKYLDGEASHDKVRSALD